MSVANQHLTPVLSIQAVLPEGLEGINSASPLWLLMHLLS